MSLSYVFSFQGCQLPLKHNKNIQCIEVSFDKHASLHRIPNNFIHNINRCTEEFFPAWFRSALSMHLIQMRPRWHSWASQIGVFGKHFWIYYMMVVFYKAFNGSLIIYNFVVFPSHFCSRSLQKNCQESLE